MTDEIQPSAIQPDPNQPSSATPLASGQPVHQNILDQTLGQLLQNNNQAQGMVMQAMQINPQQLQQLLNMTGNNQLMNQTVGDLFKNGTMQQVAGQAVQVSPQQFQQIVGSLPGVQNGQTQQAQAIQTGQPLGAEDKVPYTIPQPSPKQSFLQKLKKVFL